jgi:hypothetical protein
VLRKCVFALILNRTKTFQAQHFGKDIRAKASKNGYFAALWPSAKRL